MDATDVRELVSRCIAGDEEAQALLFVTYGDLVRSVIARKLAAMGVLPLLRADIDDIRSEIFARLIANRCHMLTRLNKPASVNAWLMTISQNYTIDFVRKWSSRCQTHAQVREMTPAGYQDSPAQAAIDDERKSRLREVLSTLPDRDRLVLDLYFIQGLKYVEIAEVLGMNINTVSARLRRAKAKLREILEGERHELTY
ncbi:MAG: sigma-70 family RNA polymerase sigma factor [Nitrospiraceae bacterium]|nr:sigma-70 family RNA polymerase sigma factor [Nitrospiraceae bacterium]